MPGCGRRSWDVGVDLKMWASILECGRRLVGDLESDDVQWLLLVTTVANNATAAHTTLYTISTIV